MIKRVEINFLLVFFLALFLLTNVTVQPLFAQENACVTSICHAKMGQDSQGIVVHSPVKDGCTISCHKATQEPDKKTKHPGNIIITLVREGSDLCYGCHEPKNIRKVVHAPIMAGDCTSCHNPHQSPNKAMLKGVIPELCFQCHPDSMMKHKVMHSPVAAGKCAECHFNHQSDIPNRLIQDGNALCLTCHPDVEQKLKAGKVKHQPAQQSCVQCHNPHGSPNKTMLNQAVPALCANCHPNEVSMTEKAITKHGPMIDDKSCTNCHESHASDHQNLLNAEDRGLCLGCHNKEMDTETGKIKDLNKFLEDNNGGKGPLKGKACVSCHNPHGSDYWRLLVKYYVPSFYSSYSTEQYSICFSCHSKEIIEDKKTSKATKFRDGRKNLHFIHVNKNAKGRTCRTCHDACMECQTPGLPNHIRDIVSFGYWQMPINFIPSEKGGSCAPGCHAEKVYLR